MTSHTDIGGERKEEGPLWKYPWPSHLDMSAAGDRSVKSKVHSWPSDWINFYKDCELQSSNLMSKYKSRLRAPRTKSRPPSCMIFLGQQSER